MSAMLRVLFVEDNPDDVVLELAALREGGFDVRHAVVEQRDDLQAALTGQEWDIVLCDYWMPELSGLTALADARRLAPAVPFILVSGTVGEEVAVESMRAGANDYVLKQNLTRLSAAVHREIRAAEGRRAALAAERALRLLAEVGVVLGRSLERAEVVREIPTIVVRELAEGCEIHLANDARPPEVVAADGNRAGQPTLTLRLMSGEREHGQLSVWRRAPYSSQERLALEDLVSRVANALEKAVLYERARRAVEVRDDFISIASHELRTPLTALQLQLERFRLQLEGDAAVSPYRAIAERLTRASGRLARLIEGLLDVSVIRDGRFELRREPFDLVELAQEVAATIREASPSAPVIRVDARGEVRGAWDHVRLEQVLTNLLSNALKYGEGKPVEVTIADLGDSARITVVDHGIGVPPEATERIFGRFERAVSSQNFGGLGVGLYVTKSIIDAHGGTISASSTPGGGATFSVSLPKSAPPPAGTTFSTPQAEA